MARDPRYDILFEPIKLGPKVARNRMFQASHCTGAGSERPGFQAHHRAIKADGGWAVVGTEYCAVAPEAETTPYISARLWDEGDVRNLTLLTEMAHDRGALARVQLYYSALNNGGLESRMHGVRKSPSHSGADSGMLLAGREMSTQEIREVQGYFVRAARLARDAGFDIVEINITINSLPHQFLLPAFNLRTDEYGGSLENRARFSIELLEQVREAVGHDTAVTARYAVDTLDAPYGLGDLGIRVEGDGGGFMQLADYLVDMWDLVVGWTDGGDRVGPARTHPENWAADVVRRARKFSEKPIGCVGRLTNPDTMVEMIRSGQCDVISAARPTIADPFIPNKIEEGRIQDIRECIGCNICLARFEIGGAPIVCTQNATVGEEFRRGWHPEKFSKARNADSSVLIVGAGPAGMECARVLGERGMSSVHLVDSSRAIGGHVRHVSELPGLREWARVIDYRQIQLDKLKNVEVISGRHLTKQTVLEYGADIVIVATGSAWSPVGMNSLTHAPVDDADATTQSHVLTPDQVFAGKQLGKKVVVYDLDGYFMAASLAERFADEDRTVTLVTRFAATAPYTEYTLEQSRLVRRLRESGVGILNNKVITTVSPSFATLVDVWDDSSTALESDSVVLVTQRFPEESLFVDLRDDPAALRRARIGAVYRTGDCAVPGQIADAVFEGHRLAREIDSPHPGHPLPYIRERRLINATESDYTLDSATIAIEG